MSVLEKSYDELRLESTERKSKFCELVNNLNI